MRSPTKVLALAPGRRFYMLYRLRIAAAPVAPRKGLIKRKAAGPSPEAVRNALIDIQKRGFNRLYQNDRLHEFSSPETLLDVDFAQPVFVVVDRLAVNSESQIAAGGFD